MSETYKTERPPEKISRAILERGVVRHLPNGVVVFKGRDIDHDVSMEISNLIYNTEGYIVPEIPRTGLGYVLNKGLLLDAISAFGMQRLNYIPQLTRLNDPDVDPDKGIIADNFYHTRFAHSLDVLALASVIGKNINFTPAQMLALQIAALTHDVLTPAGGDTTKNIDKATFDEDVHYSSHINLPKVSTFCRENNIDIEAVIAAVSGEGLLSDIRDFTDKLAYTARDVDSFVAPTEAFPVYKDALPHRSTLTDFIEKQKSLGGYELLHVWESMTVIDNRLVCKDADALYVFLKIRALMFRDLYTNPRARYNESLTTSLLTQYLYDVGILKKEALVNPFETGTTDQNLKNVLQEWFGIESMDSWYNSYGATYQAFKTIEDARVFENQTLSGGNPFVQVEDVTNFFKPATNFLVYKDTQVQTFKEARPSQSDEIETLGRHPEPIRVYYLTMPPEIRDELGRFAEWRKRRTL